MFQLLAMKKPFFNILSIALLVGSTGCASIMSGTTQSVSVQSEPAGAKATFFDHKGDAVSTQQTPFIVALHRGERYSIKVEKDKYKPLVSPVQKGVNGWYFGNVLFGGLIGLLIVDPGTGAIYSFYDPIKAVLAPSDSDKQSKLVGTQFVSESPAHNSTHGGTYSAKSTY